MRSFMIGMTLGRYQVVKKIGRGGMGEVFLARDTALERNVAIKFLAQEMLGDPTARERFLREAKSAATISACPGYTPSP
jgi:eukaryotic-like serine/threonine-protein kinase